MIHGVSQHVKVIPSVSLPEDERVLAILRDFKRLGGLPYIEAVTGLRVRTLYRHIGQDAKRPRSLGGKTREALLTLFGELDLLGGYETPELMAALRELRRRATSPGAETDPLTRGVAGRRARGVGGQDPARGSGDQ